MTVQYGFGPKGSKAALARPEESEDTFGVQTWFRDATAPGAKDGTVLKAEWLNARIGELLHLAVASEVPPPGGASNDAFLTNAINGLIRKRLAQALIAEDMIAALDTALTSDWRVAPYTPDQIIEIIDGRLGGDSWRTLSQTDIDAAVAALRNGVTSARDTLQELSAALDGLSGAVVNDLVTGGAGVPLAAQQGVVLKGLVDALSAGLAAEILARATAITNEENTRAAADAALVALSGVGAGATHLGTFSGTTIADNATIKAALQALETKAETGGGAHTHPIADVTGLQAALDAKCALTDRGLVLISTQSVASAVSSVDFVAGLDDIYDFYELVFDCLPATTDVGLQLRVQTGGSTWQTSGYQYQNITQYGYAGGGSATQNSTGAGFIRLSNTGGSGGGVSNVADRGGIRGRLEFHNPEVARRCIFQGMTAHFCSGSNGENPLMSDLVMGVYPTAIAITGIRFLFSSGNIASGRFSLYGRKKA